MHTNTKILIGFLAIILLSLSQVIITNTLQSDILSDARAIGEVEQPLENLLRDVRYHDEVLFGEVTQIVLHARTEGSIDQEHRIHYELAADAIDRLLEKDIPILLRQSERSEALSSQAFALLAEASSTNTRLRTTEREILALVEDGNVDEAFERFHSDAYEQNKSLFAQSLAEFYETEHFATERGRAAIYTRASSLIYVNLALSMVITFLVILIAFLIRSFVRGMCEKEF